MEHNLSKTQLNNQQPIRRKTLIHNQTYLQNQRRIINKGEREEKEANFITHKSIIFPTIYFLAIEISTISRKSVADRTWNR